jgi:hypothetical protein
VSWSRRRLSEQLDALAAEHEGRAFVEAVERFAAELDDGERELLGEVLLERADERGGFDYGLIRRIDEPRWKLFGRPPREHRRKTRG